MNKKHVMATLIIIACLLFVVAIGHIIYRVDTSIEYEQDIGQYFDMAERSNDLETMRENLVLGRDAIVDSDVIDNGSNAHFLNLNMPTRKVGFHLEIIESAILRIDTLREYQVNNITITDNEYNTRVHDIRNDIRNIDVDVKSAYYREKCFVLHDIGMILIQMILWLSIMVLIVIVLVTWEDANF